MLLNCNNNFFPRLSAGPILGGGFNVKSWLIAPPQLSRRLVADAACYEMGSAQSIGTPMKISIGQSLARLKTTNVTVADVHIPDERGTASVVMNFSDGTILQAFYWRLIQDGRAILSSFDHEQKYGLPAPIDAKEQLSKIMEGKICDDAQFDVETADLIFSSAKP
jgi:hypothetical protein